MRSVAIYLSTNAPKNRWCMLSSGNRSNGLNKNQGSENTKPQASRLGVLCGDRVQRTATSQQLGSVYRSPRFQATPNGMRVMNGMPFWAALRLRSAAAPLFFKGAL